jgi:hypothetical protein
MAPVGRLYPLLPLLLLLAALLVLALAYSTRPVVSIDMGTYFDSAYLHGFHAREVDAIGTGQTWPWPADRNEMTVPGGLSGDWMATVQAKPELPGRPVSGVKLMVNDYDVNTPRDSSHEFTAFLPANLVDAAELTLRLEGTPTGAPDPESGTIKQIVLQPARTYRWTSGESNMSLPGLGRGAWRLDLSLVTTHPNNQPLDARVLVNDAPLAALPDSGETRHISLLVPAHLMRQGDMNVTLRSNVYRDPRPLGVLLEGVQVSPLSRTAGQAVTLPPWGVLPASLTTVLALYACLLVLFGGVERMPGGVLAIRPSRHWLAALAVLAVLAVGAWALAAHRFPTTFMLPKLAGLALWSLLLLLLLRPLLRWAFGEDGTHRLTPGSWSLVDALLLIFFVGYWLKAGGMLYPYFIGIDVHWHMERVRWILEGQLPLLYGTDSPLNESTMPVAEWGEERPVIPYSPYFHMFATVFALLPWPLEFSANMFSALVDSSRVLIVALLARKAGLSIRGMLLAALLLAVLPVNFLLLSWGNTPTTFGLWWAFVATAFMVIAWPRLHQRGPFAVLTLLLLAALLIYTVAGVFTGLFLVCFTLALWLAARRRKADTIDQTDRPLLAGLRPLWLATALALVVSLLVYYGQYIPPIIERTLPYFAQALTQGREETGRISDTIPQYLLRHARLSYYGLVLPLVLTAVYLVWEWVARFRHARQETSPPAGRVLLWAVVAGWTAVLLLFVPVAYKISMVDKHFFVALPLLVIASAAVLDRLWRHGWPVWVAVMLYYLYLGASAIDLWLNRIDVVRQG